jgi:hypothetical protein
VASKINERVRAPAPFPNLDAFADRVSELIAPVHGDPGCRHGCKD